mmetsp:Transcript_21042/g.49819  ORF Transcript_21042/g.49819 Transcript_21042/m.49819 type:complete len:207 (-) Transcript_21042:76-696(-)
MSRLSYVHERSSATAKLHLRRSARAARSVQRTLVPSKRKPQQSTSKARTTCSADSCRRSTICTCRLGAGSTKVIVCGVRIARTFLLPVQPGVLDTRSKSCATLARAWVSFIPYRKMSTSPFCSWLGLHMGESAWSTAPPATTTPSQSLAVNASRARDVMPLKLLRKSRLETTVRPEELVWCPWKSTQPETSAGMVASSVPPPSDLK